MLDFVGAAVFEADSEVDPADDREADEDFVEPASAVLALLAVVAEGDAGWVAWDGVVECEVLVFAVVAGCPALDRYRFFNGRAVLADLLLVLALDLVGGFAADCAEDTLALPMLLLTPSPVLLPPVASVVFVVVVASEGVAAKTAAQKTMAPSTVIDRAIHGWW